jgi:hypothetical protein
MAGTGEYTNGGFFVAGFVDTAASGVLGVAVLDMAGLQGWGTAGCRRQ